ncbi:substrate-binding domain-containing protein [Noviherbaspirillum sedimenti]|uniref:LacI family DNA-binding transcriptional regulator n=1 Tax=Noviherbaspirillum sedimenti TaxID=2320865 RepID=A0A3A3G5A9_9BURK|nr:substrate-binding domain-containing protein [Noviherbaspirillum sedimenti]RJG03648.1 LacI family DNA-binding transcriptional regulator [Noviherbaspirillum sedimenti]
MNKPQNLARLEDVAKLAGVSLGSASRALSVPNQVKPKTLAKVMTAVSQLGYVRNGAARALASRKTGSIAVIYPTLKNPMFANSIDSLQQTLAELGYQLIIGSHEYNPEGELSVVRAIVERSIDGIILIGADHDDGIFNLIRQRNLPYVLTWSVDETDYQHKVGFSNHFAAYEMACRVVAKGHKHIAYCGGPTMHNERSRARLSGTLAGLKEAGLDIPVEWIIEAPFSIEGGEYAIDKLWQGKYHPTALICGTDLHAIGAVHECARRGIDVPASLSITGFDDIDFARITTPPLTTVRVPINEIGVRTAKKIVALIENQEMTEDERLTTEIIERGSLAPPPPHK